MSYKAELKGSELVLELKDEFNIYDVVSAREDILELLDSADSFQVMGTFLTSLDTAGLQLLISISKTCEAKQIKLVFSDCEKVFAYSGFMGENLNSLFKNDYAKN